MSRTAFQQLLAAATLIACASAPDPRIESDAAFLDVTDAAVDLGDVGDPADADDTGDDSLDATPDELSTDLPAPDATDTDAVDDGRDASVPDFGPPDTRPDSEDAAEEPDATPVPAHCEPLVEGRNEHFPVGPIPRAFELYLPAGVEGGDAWPIVFAWHGFGEEAATMRRFLRDEVDGDYPMILVVPEDVGLELPFGAGWDNLDASDGSLEVELFDGILECLDARWGVDPDRVHSLGFSSGAITSNLLGHLRGDRIASIASLSGAYWANPANLNPVASWPATSAVSPRYVQLLTWGGVGDSAFGFNFALTAANDQAWLNARGHDVIACDHGGGHALPDEPGAAALMAFFAAHPRGVAASPWISGLPPGYPVPWCLVFSGTR